MILRANWKSCTSSWWRTLADSATHNAVCDMKNSKCSAWPEQANGSFYLLNGWCMFLLVRCPLSLNWRVYFCFIQFACSFFSDHYTRADQCPVESFGRPSAEIAYTWCVCSCRQETEGLQFTVCSTDYYLLDMLVLTAQHICAHIAHLLNVCRWVDAWVHCISTISLVERCYALHNTSFPNRQNKLAFTFSSFRSLFPGFWPD